MRQFRKALMICCGALALAGAHADAAETSPLEVKIELRVLDFMTDPADRSTVAVLYDSAMRGSADEAAAILKALEASRHLARNKIVPRLVELHALSSEQGLKAAILPSGLSDASVLRYGIANQTLVISSGTACVKDHRCMVGVSITPDVEIGVDSSAIQAGRIQFADGFQLMVKEY